MIAIKYTFRLPLLVRRAILSIAYRNTNSSTSGANTKAYKKLFFGICTTNAHQRM